MTDTEEAVNDIDVLAPWGIDGPPPIGQWRQDILGSGFESRTIPLLPDNEGDVVTTIVRHIPSDAPEPHFVLLYVHGRNDYFFHTELAEKIASYGGAFYALDLRKYGRSLRPHQTIGFIDDLSLYDEDISEALDVINETHRKLPLILMGHSTGGLVLTMWAYRHPGAFHGLILNSAWLEIQSNQSMRTTIQPVLERVARRNPYWEVPLGGGPDFYARSLYSGWSESGFEIPEDLQAHPEDPANTGWEYAREWKRPGGYPIPAAWMETILSAHETIEKEARISAPVLSMAAKETYFGEEWNEKVFTTDIVLDVDSIVARSSTLADHVTIARFEGVHDLLLSRPKVREQVYHTIERWLLSMVDNPRA